MPLYKRGTLATLISLSLFPLAAGAVGLGEIRVVSSLGNRFRAEIPVLNPSSSISQGCFHLSTSSPDAVAEAPWLADGHISFMQDPPRLVISSRRQVLDPVVQLAVYTGCGTYLTRHYVALLSPPKDHDSRLPVAAARPLESSADSPSVTPAKPVAEKPRAKGESSVRTALPGETSGDMARRLYPRSKAAQKRFVRQMAELNPEWLTSGAGDEVLPDGAELHYPPPPVRRTASVNPPGRDKVAVTAVKPDGIAEANDRLVLTVSDSLSLVPESPSVTPGEISTRISNVEQQINMMRSQLIALRADYPTPPPAIQTLLAEMEMRLLAVELNVARINLADLASETPVAEPVPAPVAEVVEQAKPADSEKAVPALAASPPLPSVAPALASTQGFDVGLVLFGVLGLGIGLSVVLYQRTKGGRSEQDSSNAITDVKSSDDAPSEHAILPEVSVVPPDPHVQESSAETVEIPPPRVIDDPEEIERPIEMADIMLAYGQAQSAIDVLVSFIEGHPKESLRTSLHLLGVYKHVNMRQEFEALAEQLPGRFNIKGIRWEDVPDIVSDKQA